MDEKPQKTLFYPTRSALMKHNFFSQVEIKKSVTTYFSPCIDEDNKKKTVTKSEQKWWRQKPSRSTKMPKIESEKIDCLHRPCSRPAPRGKIEPVRTHSEVIEQFDSFSLLKLLFLVRNWHCWSRKAFPRQMTPQSREKKLRNGDFSTPGTADRHEKLYDRSLPAPKDATKLSAFFRFFRVFPLAFQ